MIFIRFNFFTRFSTDEGQCWHVYNFTDDPIYFTGLASEPGARSMNVSLWGYRETVLNQYWVSVTVDFRLLLSRDCEWPNISKKHFINYYTNIQNPIFYQYDAYFC